MLCRLSIPFGSKLKALFNAFAVFVFFSQFNLRIGVTTFSSLLIPLHCFFYISGSKPVLFIGDTHPTLGLRVATLRFCHKRLKVRWCHGFQTKPDCQLGLLGVKALLGGGLANRDKQKKEQWEQDARFHATVLLTRECYTRQTYLFNARVLGSAL